MSIEDSSGKPITMLEDWESLIDRMQWKIGRSAYSIAEFMLNRNGAAHIEERAARALGVPVKIERIVPEYEVRFDEFGRGRMHDLGIFAKTEAGETVFIGVEAKVDESFGSMVRDTYLDAKAKQICGVSTNAPERMERLLAQCFTEPKRAMFDIRYQLLYGTIGTLAAGADRSLFYVIVFRTDLYNETKSAENHSDYIHFMNLVGAKHINPLGQLAHCHTLNLDGKELVCIYETIDL